MVHLPKQPHLFSLCVSLSTRRWAPLVQLPPQSSLPHHRTDPPHGLTGRSWGCQRVGALSKTPRQGQGTPQQKLYPEGLSRFPVTICPPQ